MEFGLSPIPGFLFLCLVLRFGSARTQFPAAPTFFIFSPSSSGVSAALLFLPSCSFSFPSCSFSFWAAVFLLRCPVPCCLFPLPSFLAFFPRLLSRAPSSCTPSSCTPSFLTPSSPRALFPARLFFAPPFPRALFPARLFPRASFCTPSFRASRTFLPRLHSSRLEPSPQLEHSPTGTSAERNGSGWNGSKWGSNVCAIVFGASTGPSRAVYVTKLLNIFRILLKYLHNSKQPRIFAVKF